MAVSRLEGAPWLCAVGVLIAICTSGLEGICKECWEWWEGVELPGSRDRNRSPKHRKNRRKRRGQLEMRILGGETCREIFKISSRLFSSHLSVWGIPFAQAVQCSSLSHVYARQRTAEGWMKGSPGDNQNQSWWKPAMCNWKPCNYRGKLEACKALT